jgi:protein O-GlcNAc transferase
MSDLLSLAPGKPFGLRRGTPASVWYERGLAHEAAGAGGAAIAAYRRAVAGLPTHADAHCNLGRNLHEAGDLDGAEASYRAAIAADPVVALYWFNLGVVIEDRDAAKGGDPDEAIMAYEQALAIDPAFADAQHNVRRLRFFDQARRNSSTFR